MAVDQQIVEIVLVLCKASSCENMDFGQFMFFQRIWPFSNVLKSFFLSFLVKS